MCNVIQVIINLEKIGMKVSYFCKKKKLAGYLPTNFQPLAAEPYDTPTLIKFQICARLLLIGTIITVLEKINSQL